MAVSCQNGDMNCEEFDVELFWVSAAVKGTEIFSWDIAHHGSQTASGSGLYRVEH